MRKVTVWAYKRLEELDYAVGYVAIDAELAQKLTASGDVQDARQYGLTQKPIDFTYPESFKAPHEKKPKRGQQYANKELTSKADKEPD